MRFFLGENIVLFTTDGNTDKEMACGTLEGLYATIDFGTGWYYMKVINKKASSYFLNVFIGKADISAIYPLTQTPT